MNQSEEDYSIIHLLRIKVAELEEQIYINGKEVDVRDSIPANYWVSVERKLWLKGSM
jgi:hypothetical protein